jgi:hypothetical protein
MVDMACGPNVIASEVVEVSRQWRNYKKDSGNLSCSKWLESSVGHPLGFFRHRAHAISRLGEAARRTIHHDVCVWLTGYAGDDEKLDAAKRALMAACHKNGNNPLTLARAKVVVYKITGYRRIHRTCSQCEKLRAENADLLRQLSAAQKIAAE